VNEPDRERGTPKAGARHYPMVEALERLQSRGDRGALAALRRGLSPDGVANLYPYVAPYLPKEAGRRAEAAYLAVAAWFGCIL